MQKDIEILQNELEETREQKKILEEENIQRRSWELMGEVGAGQRPKSSLMEAEMDYQMNTKTGKYSFCTCVVGCWTKWQSGTTNG